MSYYTYENINPDRNVVDVDVSSKTKMIEEGFDENGKPYKRTLEHEQTNQAHVSTSRLGDTIQIMDHLNSQGVATISAKQKAKMDFVNARNKVKQSLQEEKNKLLEGRK